MSAEDKIIDQKLQNFKGFLKNISKNHETLTEYENMSRSKLQTYCGWILVPMRNNLDYVVHSMREKLEFDDKYDEKVKRYLMFFIEITTGIPFENSSKTKKKSDDSSINEEEEDDEYLQKLKKIKLN
jgi:hypothetical protein